MAVVGAAAPAGAVACVGPRRAVAELGRAMLATEAAAVLELPVEGPGVVTAPAAPATPGGATASARGRPWRSGHQGGPSAAGPHGGRGRADRPVVDGRGCRGLIRAAHRPALEDAPRDTFFSLPTDRRGENAVHPISCQDASAVRRHNWRARSMDGVVEVRGGRIRGVQRHGQWSFSGIPYARSPAGAGRWRPPGPVPGWTGIRECDRFGPIAPQSPGLIELSLGGEPDEQAEDCLTLNIWTPAPDDGRRPVMVWIHGGSFVSGSGAAALYRGGMLSREGDVVVVTINYRLGLLGFLAHPALEDPGQTWLDGREWSGSGNWGLADQVAALLLGAGPHRRFRGRPGQRDPLRRVGRRDERVHAAGHTGGARAVPPGHRAERSARTPRPPRRPGPGPSRWPPTWACP